MTPNHIVPTDTGVCMPNWCCNRPVACKQWNFNEILIKRDVTTGCHAVVAGENTWKPLGKSGGSRAIACTTRKVYRMRLFSDTNAQVHTLARV